MRQMLKSGNFIMTDAALHRVPRLFTDQRLAQGNVAVLEAAQAHYLKNVLRLNAADAVRLFNGSDGEWLCEIVQLAKKRAQVVCREKLAEPAPPPDIDYLFAPLKAARLDYIAQKATEMGARRIRPVLTQYTQVRKVNTHRLRANAIEAAEQCNLVYVPEVLEVMALDRLLQGWDGARRIIYCDEAAPIADPVMALKRIAPGPLAVLIGPEGGFAPREREMLRALPFVHAIRLGPRIMRADTAGVAALALVQAVLGDWAA